VTIDRRQFVRASLGATALVAASGTTWWRSALAAPAEPGPGPYGPLPSTPDANGLFLPEGFESRVLAVSGQPVTGTEYTWHTFPDGGATFRASGGGWIYVSNSEVPTAGAGGAGALRFSRGGNIVDAYRILDGTRNNCAGGPTPWGTWLSCEEFDGGHVWECDPARAGQGVELPALGTFSHEAAAVDPKGKAVYLTEDHPESRLYRFRPTRYPDLAAGQLQAARVDDAGAVTWTNVSATEPDRGDTTAFDGGEGMAFGRGTVVFTTKGDNRVWALNTRRQHLKVVYDAAEATPDPPLSGVDTITMHRQSGDLFVAEDGGNLELCVITAPGGGRSGEVASFARVNGPESSEVAGPAFDPSGKRLYFSSQRGAPGGEGGPGITFEITGPFRTAAASR